MDRGVGKRAGKITYRQTSAGLVQTACTGIYAENNKIDWQIHSVGNFDSARLIAE